jgi:hypothetical protein
MSAEVIDLSSSSDEEVESNKKKPDVPKNSVGSVEVVKLNVGPSSEVNKGLKRPNGGKYEKKHFPN